MNRGKTLLRSLAVILGLSAALVGCGSGASSSTAESSDEAVVSAPTTSAPAEPSNDSQACADAFNGMSKQQTMEIAFKTSSLARAGGNSPNQWLQAIRVSVGGLADHSNQCLITIMYPPTPAEYRALKAIGREPDFTADQFSYYSDGSNLERGSNGPASSLPDSSRTPNASLVLTGAGSSLGVQVNLTQ